MRRLLVYGGLAAIAAGILYGLGRWDQHIDTDERRWQEQADYALRAGKAYRELQAAGDRQLREARAEARQARAATIRAVARVDSLEREIVAQEGNTEGMATPEARADHFEGLYRKRTEQQMQTLVALQNMAQERDALGRQVGVLTAQRDSARRRVAYLEGVVAEGLEVKGCSILGLIGCPSRTTTFFAGAGTALALREIVPALLRRPD